MEPELVKIDTVNIMDAGFVETDRWKVLLEGEDIGQVWRGKRGAKGCWFVVPACHGVSLYQSHVVSGYAATTKKGAVQDLEHWHAHRTELRRLGDVVLHVFKRADREKEATASIFAVLPDGRTRWIHTTHRKERQPHMCALSEPGWYASGRRGNRLLAADRCASEDEAVELLLPLLVAETTREDKVANPPQIRMQGSIGSKVETAA